MINLLMKSHDSMKNVTFVNKRRKCVILEKIKVFPLVCSKYLSSWTSLGRSGHVQIMTFGGSISHVSDPKPTF